MSKRIERIRALSDRDMAEERLRVVYHDKIPFYMCSDGEEFSHKLKAVEHEMAWLYGDAEK